MVTLWQFIFLAKHGNAQFHWGKHSKFQESQDEDLMTLLQAYANMGGKPLHEHTMVSKIAQKCHDSNSLTDLWRYNNN